MEYRSGVLHIGNLATPDLAARFGTPLYVYDAAVIRGQIENVRTAFAKMPFRPFYAMKANSNLAILRMVHESGFGCDAVSPGEIHLARRAGFAAESMSGPGVSTPEPMCACSPTTCRPASSTSIRAVPASARSIPNFTLSPAVITSA